MNGGFFMKKEKNEKIVIPFGKFCTMYYCGDCRYLDRSDITKDREAAYCTLKRTYRCFDKDYGCSDWSK